MLQVGPAYEVRPRLAYSLFCSNHGLAGWTMWCNSPAIPYFENTLSEVSVKTHADIRKPKVLQMINDRASWLIEAIKSKPITLPDTLTIELERWDHPRTETRCWYFCRTPRSYWWVHDLVRGKHKIEVTNFWSEEWLVLVSLICKWPDSRLTTHRPRIALFPSNLMINNHVLRQAREGISIMMAGKYHGGDILHALVMLSLQTLLSPSHRDRCTQPLNYPSC